MGKLSDQEFDRISSEWSKLPDEVKEKYKNVYFNFVDQQENTGQNYQIVMDLINKNNQSKPTSTSAEGNVQYVNYNDGQFRYMDQLYGMNKPQKFISNLISQAKKNGRLTKQQDYFLMYYLKNGDTPYSHKLLPNNY